MGGTSVFVCGKCTTLGVRRRLKRAIMSRGKGGRQMDLTLINFDTPTETRIFEKGRFDLYQVGPMRLGRAMYEPGWVWSEHVGKTNGQEMCAVEHVGYVLSGEAAVKMADGTERVMRAGELFYVPPDHDSWVVGTEPYVSLHILGGETYAR
jgi:hypothetical protein